MRFQGDSCPPAEPDEEKAIGAALVIRIGKIVAQTRESDTFWRLDMAVRIGSRRLATVRMRG